LNKPQSKFLQFRKTQLPDNNSPLVPPNSISNLEVKRCDADGSTKVRE